MSWFFRLILLTVLAAGCSLPSKIQTESPQSTFSNPLLDRDFPDPTVIDGHDGWYYAYATNSRVGDRVANIQVARSQDLVHWTHLGDALPEKPSWATKDFWAPHVWYDAKTRRFLMYYSGDNPNGNNKCIGIAISENPAGPFKDKGEPLLCGKSFNTIDPMTFLDPVSGKLFFYWGSNFQPIRVREMTPDGLHFANNDTTTVVLPEKDKPYSGLIEGTWVIYRNGWYYLFYSGDNCCGTGANYAVMVARAKNPKGPFQKLGDANGTGNSAILEKNDRWFAPGHNSILTDRKGNDWMFYHALHNDARLGARVMLMDRVLYRDGWPYIPGGTPSSTSTAPSVGAAPSGRSGSR